MKNQFNTLLIMAMCALFAKDLAAQDVIILRNGDEIQAVVNEIGIDLIKYKKYENLAGPIYTIEISKVFMIKYENGTKDVFTSESQQQVLPKEKEPEIPVDPISEEPVPLEYRWGVKQGGIGLSDAEVRLIMAPYPVPLDMYNQGRGLQLAGSVFQWTTLGVLMYTAIKGRPLDPPESETLAKKGLIAAGACAVTWLVLGNVGTAKIRKSVDAYNHSITKPTSMHLNLMMNDTGIGLALRF